jgi:hypothetical protein
VSPPSNIHVYFNHRPHANDKSSGTLHTYYEQQLYDYNCRASKIVNIQLHSQMALPLQIPVISVAFSAN